MKKKIRFMIIIIVCCAGYSSFIYSNNQEQTHGSFPEFKVDQDNLQISVHDDQSKMLEGIHASDKEDGDLSSQVFVESISSFNEENKRTVTYGVFDSDDNLTRCQRTISYTDYQAPQITLIQPLSFIYVDSNDVFLQCVQAQSVVDGDISSQVSVVNTYYEESQQFVEFAVTDSCGMTSKLKLKVLQPDSQPNITITLSEYLIRVPKGTRIDPEDYIQSVKLANIENKSLRSQIEIMDDYDRNNAGTYEFIYRIKTANGDYGVTKLVVIVE